MSIRQFILAIVVIAILFLGGIFTLSHRSQSSEISNEKTKIFSFLKSNSNSKSLYSVSEENNGTNKAFMRVGTEPPTTTKSLLDGSDIMDYPESVYVVMIDNHRAAREHHTGLTEAKIIIEMPAEGGIPRLAAMFSSHEQLEKIGPVRSVRPYFLDILRSFKPIIIHAGGSDVAMEYLASSSDFCDLDHQEGNENFWRDDNILKPHNLFINTENILNYAEEKDWNHSLTESVFELESAYFEGEEVIKFDVDFGMQVNKVSWNWSKDNQAFIREQQDENEEIEVNNVIVIISEQWLLGDDDKSRIGVTTTGEGSAFIFRDGKVIEGNWQREDDNFFKFIDLEGNSIPLAKGKTFFEFIGEKSRLNITKK